MSQRLVFSTHTGQPNKHFLGQTVFTGEVAMRGGKGALDVSNLVPGIYVVVFRTPDGGREQFKVVVE